MNPMLWGFQAPSLVRIFLTLRLPPDIRVQVEALTAVLCRAHSLGGVPIGGERLHVTLAGLHAPGDAPNVLIARTRSAMASFHHGDFPICFDRSVSFRHGGDRHPFVLRGDLQDLIAFRLALAQHLAKAGFAVDPAFTPHMTLVWADRRVDEHPIRPIRWQADGIFLILSPYGQSRHIVLQQWPLAHGDAHRHDRGTAPWTSGPPLV